MFKQMQELFILAEKLADNFDIEIVDNINKAVSDTIQKTVNELKMMHIEKHFVIPFLKNLRTFLKNINVKRVSNTYFLYDGTSKKGIGKITYSPEKDRVYFYVISKHRNQKVFSKKLDQEILTDDILKFIKTLTELIKTENHHKDITKIFNSKKFNKKLFKNNIEKDLGIKIKYFRIHTNKPSYVLIYDSDEVSLKEVAEYLDEYFVELEQMNIKLPEVIEIKSDKV